MIVINENDRSVTITNSTGTIVKIDGNEYTLTNGGIELVNLPSFYDVVVYGVLEEIHTERPIVVEEEIVFEEEIVIEEPIIDPEIVE